VAGALAAWIGTASPAVSAAQPPQGRYAELVTPQVDAAVDRGLRWLVARQQDDGAYAARGSGRNVAVCSLAGMAFLAEGSTPGRGDYGAAIDRTLAYLVACADRQTGVIAADDTLGRGPMYGHGFATLLLCETHGMARTPSLRERVAQAVQVILQAQHAEGGWRYTPEPLASDVSVTVCQLMALRAARNAGVAVPRQSVERAAAYLRQCQNSDGGYRYMRVEGDPRSAFARSAAACAALLAANLDEPDEVARAVGYLEQFRSPAAQAERPYYFYGQYYAIQAMWFVGGDAWNAWYAAVRDELLAAQSADGSWNDPQIGPEYATAIACIVLQTPNNYLPILQR
jgi:hypothetical protein